jgi:serine/threonine-protein kinase RsbW
VAGRTIELEIPPRNDYLALVRRAVTTAARLHDRLPDRRVEDLSLAVSEACTNAISAGRVREVTAPVHVQIELTETGVAVTVTDHAGGFEPEEVDPIPAVDDPKRLRHEGGLGLPLIRSLADAATFTPTDDGTAVRILVTVP